MRRGERSTPSTRVKPRRSRAIKPLPRPQKSSTISALRGHCGAPKRLRRAINFRISSSGVSKRKYAASQGSGDSTFWIWEFVSFPGGAVGDVGIFDEERENYRRFPQMAGQFKARGTPPSKCADPRANLRRRKLPEDRRVKCARERDIAI